jgi:hypothetical protein
VVEKENDTAWSGDTESAECAAAWRGRVGREIGLGRRDRRVSRESKGDKG